MPTSNLPLSIMWTSNPPICYIIYIIARSRPSVRLAAEEPRLVEEKELRDAGADDEATMMLMPDDAPLAIHSLDFTSALSEEADAIRSAIIRYMR